MKMLSKFEMKRIMGGEVTQDEIGEEGAGCANNSCTADADCCSTSPSCEKATWGDKKYCFKK